VTLDRLEIKVVLAARDHQAMLVQLGLRARLEHQAPKGQLVRKVRQVLKGQLVLLVYVVIVVILDYQVTLAAQEMMEAVDQMASLESWDRTA